MTHSNFRRFAAMAASATLAIATLGASFAAYAQGNQGRYDNRYSPGAVPVTPAPSQFGAPSRPELRRYDGRNNRRYDNGYDHRRAERRHHRRQEQRYERRYDRRHDQRYGNAYGQQRRYVQPNLSDMQRRALNNCVLLAPRDQPRCRATVLSTAR